jgi:thiamine-monophosphate kinase
MAGEGGGPPDRAPVSEARFHAWLRRSLPGRAGLLPMGDDVAALRIGNRTVLLTTDALSEGTHFRRASPPAAIGAAAIGASLSDIAAKGGRPVAALLDLLVPPATPERWLREVVRGAERCARRHGFHVAGGDTKPSAGRSVVGTVIGTAGPGRLPAHDRARPGDRILVTGWVGAGGVRARPVLEGRRPTGPELRELLSIRPRLAEGQALAPLVRAMVDTSDGLAAALHRIADASGVAIELEEGRLPLSPALRAIPRTEARLRRAFFGGDYELVATVPAPRAPRAVRAVESVGGRATLVGRLALGRGAWITGPHGRRPLPVAGWDPFAREWTARGSLVGGGPR